MLFISYSNFDKIDYNLTFDWQRQNTVLSSRRCLPSKLKKRGECAMAQIIKEIVSILYITCLLGLAVYGFNNLITSLLYLKSRKNPKKPVAYLSDEELPVVTIQLPLYNELYIVERLINAVAHLDYPRHKLQIQVLDDSTDDTTNTVANIVEKYRNQGADIELIHRSDRSGFKAGALAKGMESAKGEIIGIFDADFIPPRDWLRVTVPEFEDKTLACLQTRWGHTNNTYNLFTRAVALGIDGHFIVEQTARSRNGLLMNFNGTAGLWRRAAIVDAGGWQSDTLTEDLDLSYRAQLRGWRVGYLPDVEVPAELPAQVEAFKRQQFRWAKGTFQTVKKLVPGILKSDKPLHVKIMGLMHITGYSAHPLMLIMVLLILPVGLLDPHTLRFFPWTIIASFGPPFLYMCSKTRYCPRLIDRIKLLPALTLIGFGLSLSNTVAVMQGLFSKKTGTFVRTPKFNIVNDQDKWTKTKYAMKVNWMVWAELALAIYSIVVIFILYPYIGFGIIPCLLIYALGYSYMAILNLVQTWQVSHPHLERTSGVLADQKTA